MLLLNEVEFRPLVSRLPDGHYEDMLLIQANMRGYHLKFIVLGLILAVLFVLIALPRIFEKSFSVNSQRDWIRNAMEELAKAGPPPSDTNHSAYRIPWILPNYLIFSNGWATYKIHTIHKGEDVGDTTVLRTSEGAFYLCHTHFCTGITKLMHPSPFDEQPCAQPLDAKDFFENVGRLQGWNLINIDNQLWFVINVPREPDKELGKKPFWVWIASVEGTNQITLFENRYTVSGNYVSWNTHWLTNDFLVVDVYDYGTGRSAGMYPESLRSNHIKSLTFFRDKQTGKFTEKK